MTNQKDTIVTVLHDIQQKLKAPKGQYNNFGKYAYRNCEDILEAVKPLLPESIVLIVSDELVKIGDRYYIKATAKLTNSVGEFVETTAYAREAEDKKGMDSSQITGATSSYSRKYALNGLFLIDDTKDADSDEKKGGRLADDKDIKEDIKNLGFDANKIYDDLLKEMNTCSDLTTIEMWGKRVKSEGRTKGLPIDLRDDITNQYNNLKTYYLEKHK